MEGGRMEVARHGWGVAALLDDIPKTRWLLGHRDYDADWLRGARQAKGTQWRRPDRRSRNEVVKYDKRRYWYRSHIKSCTSVPKAGDA